MTTENQYAPATTASPRTNVLAIVSLVTGILGFNIIAIILGAIALNMIKKSGESGRGFAIAGIILGAIGLVFVVILTLVFSIAAATTTVVYSS